MPQVGSRVALRVASRASGRCCAALAAQRFGDEVAASLGELLEGWASEDLVRVGAWIVECGSGDELLGRVREVS